MTASNGSVVLVEDCAHKGGDESEIECAPDVHDDFFTPPPTPNNVPSFRRSVQLQFQMLQSLIIVQHEKDVSLLKDEIEQLRRRLLANESECVTPAVPEHVTPLVPCGSCGPATQTENMTENMVPVITCCGAAHRENSLPESNEILPSNTPHEMLSDGAQYSGFVTPLEGLPLRPSSPRLFPCSLESAPSQSEVTARDATFVVLSSEAAVVSPVQAVPEAVPEVTETAITDHTCIRVSVQLEDDAGAGHEQVPLLGRKPAEITKSVRQEVARTEEATHTHGFTQLPHALPKSHRGNFEHLETIARMKAGHHQMVRQLYNSDLEKAKSRDSIGSHDFGSRLTIEAESTLCRMFHRLQSDVQKSEQFCRSRIQKFVFSSKFDLISGGLILTNGIAFAFSMQHSSFDSEHAIRPEYGTAEERWPGASKAFAILEYLFTVAFVLEMLLRLFALGPRVAIRSMWMWFDFVVIGMGIFDTFGAGSLGMNTSVIRLFRLVRLVRILKIFQSMESLDSLFLLVKAVQASVHSMAYSFIMMLILQVVFAMFMCQMLQPLVLDDERDLKLREDIFKYFGSFSRSVLSMFEITLANWVPTCRLLVDEVHEAWMLFFIFYRCMFCFALIKVISAVFITETNRILSSDDELYLMKQKREKSSYTAKLSKMFRTIDLDGDGDLVWEELQELLAYEGTAEYLTTLGFETHDFEKLFWLIDEGEGKISISDFVSKVGKLKGMSKAIDTLTILKLTHRIEMLIQGAIEKHGLLEKNVHMQLEEDREMFSGRQSVLI